MKYLLIVEDGKTVSGTFDEYQTTDDVSEVNQNIDNICVSYQAIQGNLIDGRFDIISNYFYTKCHLFFNFCILKSLFTSLPMAVIFMD